jgi:MazG family protein
MFLGYKQSMMEKDKKNIEEPINKLAKIMSRLRDPDNGCPWDLEQNFSTIAPHTIEEAYEVADAIERGDMEELKDELGDLIFQVIFYAQMAKEENLFDLDDVINNIADKMIHRHPHVFGDQTAKTADDVTDSIWEAQKDKEAKRKKSVSILDDVTKALPAIMRAQKLQKRAARVGFEWPEAVDVLDKLEEEIKETRNAIKNKNQAEIHEEIGDMMFCVVNFGRMLGVDCETSLRDINNKFERRFKGIEKGLKEKNVKIEEASLEEMEALWQEEKIKEKRAG